MKKLQIIIVAFLILLSICSLASMQAKAAPIIGLSPTSGYAGDSVTVTGSSFASGSTITIKFDSTTMATTPSQVITTLGAFTANFTVPASTVGAHTVSASDTNGNTGTATFTVETPPTVSIAPASWTMDVGQSKTFTATASGGSGSYSSYQWYVGGLPQTGQIASTFSYSPTSAGLPSITVTVNDTSGTTSVQSSAPALTVNASPTVSITPAGSLTMDVGQVQMFTATPSGGSGTISYQWYLDGSGVGSNSASYSYTASGTSHSITCQVTDSASPPVTSPASNAVSITVNPALVAPTVTANPTTINQGQTTSLTSTAVSTGTSPYSYQWLQKAPGAGSYSFISGATSSSYSFATSSSTASGAWSFELQVTDAVSATVTSSPLAVAVNALPTVSVSPASWAMDVGQSKTFTATPSGGSGIYNSYQWYVDGSAQSGQTLSTFSYSPISAGSPSITVTVTDSLGTTSAQSSAPALTVNASPTVSITPAGSLTMDVGQVQVFIASASGGSGTVSYQWYLEGAAVSGAVGTSYSFTASGTSHSITCQVTDSASPPVTSPASNAVSITVNPALVAPTVTANPTTINQGQTTSLTSTDVSTGTSPYSYQWLQKAPGGSFAAVGSNSASFSFVTSGSTVTGTWSFIIQVNDSVGQVVNSSAVSVAVNIAPLDHFVFSSIGVQTAGTSFSITITAKNSLNQTLSSYAGTNTLNVSTGTISPTTTGNFSNGVWTGSVTVTDAGSGIYLLTSGSSMSGTSGTFTVNPGLLDHFTFGTISDQNAGSAFNITVTAEDAFNNTLTDYAGTPSLTYSAGAISPATMNTFVDGVGSTSVTVNAAGSGVTITATYGTHIGTSNSFTVTISATPSPSPAATPTNAPTPTSKPGTTSTPSPTLSPTPSTSAVPTKTSNGTTIPPTPSLGLVIAVSVTSAAIILTLVVIVIKHLRQNLKGLSEP